MVVSNREEKQNNLDDVDVKMLFVFFYKGDAGGCGFCPPAAPGLLGDRGSQGYRGRPGVSII